MPIPEQRDLEGARGVLARWLARQLDGARDVEVGPISGPAFTGFSNETLLFDASWTLDGTRRTEGLVVRVKPTQHTVFLESDFDFQVRVLQCLAAHTDVPVPRIKWYETDATVLGAPFFVMERLDGRVPADSPPYTVSGWLLEESTPQQRRTLVQSGIEALARVHAVDWRALGLDFLDKPRYGSLGFEQQLRYYEAAYEWARAGQPPNPVADATLRWIHDRVPVRDPEITLCWGDARINNQMFDADHRVVAVLDWEMVTLADPMMDLGWWLFLDRHFHEGLHAPRMEGFLTREEMVEHYAACSGREPRDLFFYEIFAGFRFAVVMQRIAGLLVEFEMLPPDNDLGANNTVTQVLADMLGLPAPGPRLEPWGATA